jgi:hypothetical protein
MALLDIFGHFPADAVARIRGGRGAVGRIATVMVIALIVLGTIAYRISNENFLMIAGAAIIVFVTLVVRLLLNWAERNPELAVMEGLDLAAYKQAGIEAKNRPALNPLPPTTDPLRAPPSTPLLDAPDDE